MQGIPGIEDIDWEEGSTNRMNMIPYTYIFTSVNR